jgi:hypothetical protein
MWFCSVPAGKHLKEDNYTHPLLFAGSYFVLFQIHRVTRKIKMFHSDPSMDRSIKNVQQLEQVFEPHCKMFMELKEKISNSHDNVSAKKRKTLKILKVVFWGVVNYLRIFTFCGC